MVDRNRQHSSFNIQEFACLLDCSNFISRNFCKRHQKKIPKTMPMERTVRFKPKIKQFSQRIIAILMSKCNERSSHITRWQYTKLIAKHSCASARIKHADNCGDIKRILFESTKYCKTSCTSTDDDYFFHNLTTTPFSASTSTISPSFKSFVDFSVPTTHGLPHSRDMIAA